MHTQRYVRPVLALPERRDAGCRCGYWLLRDAVRLTRAVTPSHHWTHEPGLLEKRARS